MFVLGTRHLFVIGNKQVNYHKALPKTHFLHTSAVYRKEYSYVDTHIHIDKVLERLRKPLDHCPSLFENSSVQQNPFKLEACIHISCSSNDFSKGLFLLKNNDSVFGSFGIHPHRASQYNGKVENIIETIITRNPKAIALGECGLDYYRNLAPQEIQRNAFIRQIQLAVKLQVPLVIHTRNAENDTYKIMMDHLPRDHPIHVHCFTSSLPFAQSLMRSFSRLHFGFTGAVTFKNGENLRKTVENVPIERILLETDGPYMAPDNYRGEVCLPSMITDIAPIIAKAKGVDVEELYIQTRLNTKNLYGV